MQLARLLAFAALGSSVQAAVPLVRINDSLYQTEHCLFIIDGGNQFGFPDYNSVYSQANLASYLDTLVAHFPGTYFSICYLAKNLSPDNVPIYTTRIFKATGIVTPGTPGASQSFATLDYCRYNLGTSTVLPTALAVYGHELGHAWGARVLGEAGHWSSGDTIWCRMGAIASDDGYVTLDRVYGTPAAGFRWRRVDSRQASETQTYSDQELYLMGVEPTLPTYYRLNGPVYNSDSTMAYSSVTTCDQAAMVAAYGARSPDFRQSQKRFKVAFVYIARDLADVQTVAPQFELSAEQFCDGESLGATTFRGQLPYLCMTKYRASVDGLLADLDGNATPILTVADPYTSSTDGAAVIHFTASDPDGIAPIVSVVPASGNCSIQGNTVQIAGLPTGVYFFTLKAEDAGGKKDFDHFVVEIQRPAGSALIITQPVDQVVQAGNVATFSVAAAGSPANFIYQWWRRPSGQSTWSAVSDGGGFSGATTTTLAISAVCAMDDDQFFCAVGNGSGTVSSAPATLTVLETPPVILSSPVDVTMGPGGGANFTVAMDNPALVTGYFRYQWQRLAAGTASWVDLAVSARYINATGAGLTVSGTTLAMDGDQFRCVITNSAGVITSNSSTMHVVLPPAISSQPTGATVALGGNTSFTVASSGVGTLSYQWYLYANPVVGATSATLTLANVLLTDGGYYCVKVTNSGGTTTSSYALLTVTGGVAPTVVSNPANQTITEGGSAAFPFVIAGTAPFTYSWRVSTTNGSNWSVLTDNSTYSGTGTATLTVAGGTTAMTGYQFVCYGSNPRGVAQSTAVTLTVNAVVVPPTYSLQPIDETVSGGNTACFSAFAGTAPVSYRWQRSTDGGSTWTDLNDAAGINGATSDTLNIVGTFGMTGSQFRCVASNGAGSITSAAVTLRVIPTGFDPVAYLALNPDVAFSIGEVPDKLWPAWVHYWTYGLAEGRPTGDGFAVDDYLAINPDLQAGFGTNRQGALLHWLNYGKQEGRMGSVPPQFELDTYFALNPDVLAVFGNNRRLAWFHFATYGILEGRSLDGWFSPAAYLAMYPDLVPALGGKPLAALGHWFRYGRAEGRGIPAWFDIVGYLARYPDVEAAYGTDLYGAWRHFVRWGAAAGRSPDPAFDPVAYLAAYPELRAGLGNDPVKALQHWIDWGKQEGRLGSIPAGWDPAYYLAHNPDLAAFGDDEAILWQHCIAYGVLEGREVAADVKPSVYLELNPDLNAAFGGSQQKALLHWYLYGKAEGRLGR